MAAKSKQNATLTREELDKQIKSYLKNGGKIEQVESGVTGMQPLKGPKHIVINPAKK